MYAKYNDVGNSIFINLIKYHTNELAIVLINICTIINLWDIRITNLT